MVYLIFLFISLITNAQDRPEDFLEVAKFAESISKGIYPTAPNQHCAEESAPRDEMICHCELGSELSHQYHTFLLSYPNSSSLPEILKSQLPGQILEGHTRGAVNVLISLPNDNKFFGLWGMMFGNDGDDLGYTHGASVSISRTNKSGLTTSFIGSSDLYTQAILKYPGNFFDSQGVYHKAQKFTNENLLRLVVDSKSKGNLLYWKAGLGWHRLDSRNTHSLLLASGQQFRWHNMLQDVVGPRSISDPIYIQDKKGIRDSFQVETFLGLQKNFIFGSSCRINSYAQTGGRLAPLGATSFDVGAGTYFFYQKPSSPWALKLGSSATLMSFKNGQNTSLSYEMGLESKRVQFSIVYTQTYGKLNNYQSYNLPHIDKSTGAQEIEPIMNIRLGFIIGSINPN
jgi:hypothetical protein